MSGKIFIILPTHNRINSVARFINCLLAQTYNNYKLIVVDDGSTDKTAEEVMRLIPSATVLFGNGNLWWAGALQKGINFLKDGLKPELTDIVLFANDDTTFDSNFFEKAINILRGNQKTLLLPKWKMDETDRLIETGVFYDPANFTFRYVDNPDEINLFTTMCLFLRWSDILEIGDFYTSFLPHYNSDSEYTYRAHKKGFKLVTRNDFWIMPDRTQTGFHKNDFKNMTILNFIKTYFRRKSSSNPFCKISMILLTSPFGRIIPNIGKVLAVVVKDVVRALNNSIAAKRNCNR